MKFSVLILFFLVSCIPSKKTSNEEQNNNNNNQQSDDAECSATLKKFLQDNIDLNDFQTNIEEIKQKAVLLKNNNNIFTISDIKKINNEEISYVNNHCKTGISGLSNERCTYNNVKINIEKMKKDCSAIEKIINKSNFGDISKVAGKIPSTLKPKYADLKTLVMENIQLIIDNFAE